MREYFLARIQERLERFVAENSPETVLSNDATLEVMNLLNATPDSSTDTDVLLAAGILHWCRYIALGLDDGRLDLSWACDLLMPVYQRNPDLLPVEIHEYLSRDDESVIIRAKLSHHSLRLYSQAARTGNVETLSEAIDLFRRTLTVTPDVHPVHIEILSNLATALKTRFDWTGTGTDVDEAIELARLAVARTPQGHPLHCLILSGLSGALWTRFVHRNDLTDLEDSLREIRRAVAVTPPGNPDRGRYLSNLSGILRTHFEWTEIRDELNEAVAFGRQAVAVTPANHSQYATMLTNLATALQTRFAHTGALPDLAEATDNFTRAVEAIPPDHPHVPAMLGNLSASLLVRATHTGTTTDLTKAVEAARQAVAATPPGNPDLAKRLMNLGNILRIRFHRAGLSSDLDEAVEVCRQAVAATPIDHSERSIMLTNLGAVVGLRANRAGLSADLDEAVNVCRQALSGISIDHSSWVAVSLNFCEALRSRFKIAGLVTDLDEAVETTRMTVATAREKRNEYAVAATLSELGAVLNLRYDQSGDVADLDSAVDAYRMAVSAQAGDPDRANFLRSLGLALWARFERTGVQADRDDGMASLRSAAAIAVAAPSIRAKTAGAWASMAATEDDWRQAAEGYATAIDLLARVAPRSLSRQDQEYQLAYLSSLGSQAAACCLQIGEVERALELWERGRGIIFGQILDADTDLTELAEKHPETAARFRRIREDFDGFPLYEEPATKQASYQFFADEAPSVGRLDSDSDRRHELAEQYEMLVSEIRTLPDFERFLLPPLTEDLRHVARHGPIVAVNVSEIRCDALILTQNGVQILPLPGLTADIVSDYVVDFLRALDQDDETRISQILGWLWDVLAGPVLGRLEIHSRPEDGSSWPRVWWCLSGWLSFLPIHAAGHHHTRFDPAPDTLIDRVISSYTPTIRALSHARRPALGPASYDNTTPASEGRGGALVVAMPHTPDAGDLPGARIEAEALQRRFSDRVGVLIDGEATCDAVLAALPQARWAHFACHGKADISAPSTSRLLLHDRPLTVLDVNRLRLADAELAFLSACETARPSGDLSDEAIHLASAFQLAGYRHVIATLWPVSDGHAVELSENIYCNLTDGEDAAAAVHNATRGLRDYAARYPSVWASHIHVGA